MSLLLLALIVVFLIGAGIGIYALAAPRRLLPIVQPSAIEPAIDIDQDAEWSLQAGSEFAGLSEAARCEMVFAIAALDDQPSRRLLVSALNDTSEAVVLAAAHALASAGQIAEVQAYAGAHPGPRADRVIETLALLES